MTGSQKRRTPLAGGANRKEKHFGGPDSTPREATGNKARESDQGGVVFYTWPDGTGRTHALRRSFGFCTGEIAYTVRSVPSGRINTALELLGMRNPLAAKWRAVSIAIPLSFRNEPSTPARRAA